MHGYGRLNLAGGDSYEGDFCNDQKHGSGVYISKTGNCYKGIQMFLCDCLDVYLFLIYVCVKYIKFMYAFLQEHIRMDELMVKANTRMQMVIAIWAHGFRGKNIESVRINEIMHTWVYVHMHVFVCMNMFNCMCIYFSIIVFVCVYIIMYVYPM